MSETEEIVIRNEKCQVTKEVRTWAMVSHLVSLIGFISTIGIPIGNVVGPLVVWIFKKDSSMFVDAHAKESMNFQISMSLYITFIGAFFFIPIIGWFFAPAIYGLLVVIDLIVVIIAAVKANDGATYRYPITIRFIK